MAWPPEFDRYLEDFAGGRFYQAHEHLERLWWARASDPFLQGLILFAAAYVKLQRGNARGARRHFEAAARYLEPYEPRARGVDVAVVRTQATQALSALAGVPDGPDLLLAVPPFRFVVDRGEAASWGVPPPLPDEELAAVIRDEIVARARRGEPVGSESWAAVVKEVARRTGGRVGRDELRAAVRRALAGPPPLGLRAAGVRGAPSPGSAAPNRSPRLLAPRGPSPRAAGAGGHGAAARRVPRRPPRSPVAPPRPDP